MKNLPEKMVEMREYNDVVYVPSGVNGFPLGLYNREGYIYMTGKRVFGSDEYTRANNANIDELYHLATDYIDETVIWYGFSRCHYGHFLVDEMSRLWWTMDSQFGCFKILYDTYEKMELPNFIIHIWELLDIAEENRMRIRKPVRIRKILVPELSYVPEKYVSQQYFDTFQFVMSKVEKSKKYDSKRIYLSRSHFAKKKHLIEIGEKSITKLFKKNGFDIVYPEEMSFIEQLECYKNCEFLASTNGSLAHNILWCGKNTKEIICDRFEDENMHQLAINSALKTELYELKCFVKGANHNHSIYVISDDLKNFFREELHYSKLPRNRLSYFLIYYISCFFQEIIQRVRSILKSKR